MMMMPVFMLKTPKAVSEINLSCNNKRAKQQMFAHCTCRFTRWQWRVCAVSWVVNRRRTYRLSAYSTCKQLQELPQCHRKFEKEDAWPSENLHMRQASISRGGDKRMDQKKNHNWQIIILRSGGLAIILWLGSVQAVGQHQKGGKYAKAGKA